MQGIRSKLTYANVMVTVLMFIVVGGVAYATVLAPKNSVNSQAIIDGQVKGADLTPRLRPLWAVVEADSTSPSIVRSSGAVGLQRISDGVYEVQFNRSVAGCSPSATQIGYGAIEAVQAYTNRDLPTAGLNDDEIFVQTVDNSANTTDIDFNLQVFC